MLDADGETISLKEDNVIYIKQDGKELTANADATLWFSTTKPAGKYRYEVKAKDGTIYIAILNWD